MISGGLYEKDGSVFAFPALDVTEVYKEGKKDGLTECAAKHFVIKKNGSGTTSFDFKVPFKPDAISIMAVDQAAGEALGGSTVLQLHILPYCNGKRSGTGIAMAGETISLMQFQTSTFSSKYERSEDGTITIHNLEYYKAGRFAEFSAEAEYLIVAAKY